MSKSLRADLHQINAHIAILSPKTWNKKQQLVWSASLFIGTAVLYAARAAFPLSIATIALEYNWSKSTSGAVLSCFFWGYATTQLGAGWLADRWGGEFVLEVAAFTWSILTLATPLLLDLAHMTPYPMAVILAFRIATGVAQGFHIPSMASLVSRRLSASEKGRVFGLVLAGSHVGVVLAGMIGSFLLVSSGWRTIFQLSGFTALIWCCSFRYLTEISSQPPPLSLVTQEDDEKKEAESQNVPWGTLFSHPSWWAAGVAQYVGGNAYYTIFNWLPSYFHDNFPEAKGVVYNVVPGLCIICTAIMAPSVASRVLSRGNSLTTTRKVVECTSLIGVSVCLLLVSMSSSFYISLLLFSLALAARGFHHGGVSVNPQDFAPNHTGAVYGIFNTFGSMTGFVGVYVAGHVLEATGNNWAVVFWLTAAQCVVGSAVYALWGTAKRII